MRLNKKVKTCDLIQVLRILKKTGIKSFDKRIPILLLKIFYSKYFNFFPSLFFRLIFIYRFIDFLWDVIYQAKLLSRVMKKKKIDFEDVNKICKLIFLKISKQKRLSRKIHSMSRIINSEPLSKNDTGLSFEMNFDFIDQFFDKNIGMTQKKKKKIFTMKSSSSERNV